MRGAGKLSVNPPSANSDSSTPLVIGQSQWEGNSMREKPETRYEAPPPGHSEHHDGTPSAPLGGASIHTEHPDPPKT